MSGTRLEKVWLILPPPGSDDDWWARYVYETWEQAAAVIADADDIAVTDELVTLVTVASTDERYAIHIVAVPIKYKED